MKFVFGFFVPVIGFLLNNVADTKRQCRPYAFGIPGSKSRKNFKFFR